MLGSAIALLVPSVLWVLTALAATGNELGDTMVRDVDSMTMVWVPAGTFRMGSTDEQIDDALALCEAFRGQCAADWFDRERPAHDVSVSGFWIDQTEVTNAQFCAFLNSEGNCSEGGRSWLDERATSCRIEQVEGTYEPLAGYEEHPVVEVTWYGATAYARWIGGRLPTEAEWAYAARGPDSLIFPWGNAFRGDALSFCDANCAFDTRDSSADDGHAKTAPVGSFPLGASWVGALDLAGNVWEWCADWYGGSYVQTSPSRNPVGPKTGLARVCRGGAWGGDPYDVRSARRGDIHPRESYESIGFRCVMDTGTRPP